MKLSIAKDFSQFPAGRFRDDGPYSGEGFRDDLLAPALKESEVEVHLDGVEGYGSSFLEEAFGGLVRKHGYTPNQLRSRLKIITSDPAWLEEVWSYIDHSGANG